MMDQNQMMNMAGNSANGIDQNMWMQMMIANNMMQQNQQQQ